LISQLQTTLVRLFFLAAVLATTIAQDDKNESTTITTDEAIIETTLAPAELPAAPSPTPSVAPIKQHAFLDGNTLLPLLLASGGPPGEFPVENDQKPSNDTDCTAWLYEYT